MKTKIISQKSNHFLEREEFVVEVMSGVAPTKDEVVKEFGKSEELTVIRKLQGLFGTDKFVADIFVYGNLEAKDKTEVVTRKARRKLAEEKKKKLEEEKKKKAEEKKKALEAKE